MSIPNIFTPSLDSDPKSREGFHTSDIALHRLLGAKELIVNVVEIEPGDHLCPYHYEYVEEWLVVLSGPVALRTPEGTEQLGEGAVRCFPAGPAGAHRVSAADTSTPARVLMFSRDVDPSVCVYPDSDKLAVFLHDGGEDEVFVRRAAASSHLDYYDGETP